MKTGLHIRTLLISVALGISVSACQTPSGTTWNSSGQPQTTASSPEQRVSQEFYLPFYDQNDHLKSLIEENNLTDADRLYVEQKPFFSQNRKISAPLLDSLAQKLNAQQIDGLELALGKTGSIKWPISAEHWGTTKQSLKSAQSAIAKYPTTGLLSEPEFRDNRITRLEKTLAKIVEQIKNSSEDQFVEFSHFGTDSFFDVFPVELEPDAVLADGFPALGDKLANASPEQIRQFVSNYDEALLGDDRWAEVSNLYVAAHLRQQGSSSPDLINVLGAVSSAKEIGLNPKSVSGLNIGFVEVTSKTLLNQGQIDFPATVDIDLPVEASKADLDTALDKNEVKNFDYLIIFDVALAKASRRVLKLTPIRSVLLAGYKDVDNPDYAVVQQNVEIAKINFNQASIQAVGYHGPGLAGALSQIVAGANQDNMREELEQSMQNLAATPKTIKEPVHQTYNFKKATIDARKTMTVHYYIIDQRKNTYFKSSFDVSENERFDVAYDIHPDDLKNKENTAAYATEKDVDEFEKQSSSVKVSQLVNNYIANRSQSKKLRSLTALRKEMLADKNTALASYKANSFDARPLNDPRFDSVVAIFLPKSLGTGFFVKPDVVLTNWHVVDNQKFIEMKTYDGQETFGKVLGKDVRLDLALVKVQTRGKPVKFYTKNKIDLGATVEALGHPQGHEFSITRGVVSAVRKYPSINLPKGAGDDVLYLQTDAPISGGNSGGPLFLGDQVVGVNTWSNIGKNKTAQNLNFAVHYSEVLAFLKEYLPGFQVLTN